MKPADTLKALTLARRTYAKLVDTPISAERDALATLAGEVLTTAILHQRNPDAKLETHQADAIAKLQEAMGDEE